MEERVGMLARHGPGTVLDTIMGDTRSRGDDASTSEIHEAVRQPLGEDVPA